MTPPVQQQALQTVPILKREYLDMVPEFDGKQISTLNRFIEIADKLILKFYNYADSSDFQNEYLISSLRAKLKGPAADVVNNTNVTYWEDIKTALKAGFADKRDIYSLTIEMSQTRQTNETPFAYYNRIQKLLHLQISYLNCELPLQAPVLSEHYKNLALRILLRGLREPLGSLMRTKNPRTLAEALGMLTNDFQFSLDGNLLFGQTLNNNNKFRNNNNSKPAQQQIVKYIPKPNQSNWQPPKFNTNNQINKPQQIVRPGNNNNQYKQTPMSISTRNTQYSRAPFNNTQRTNLTYRPQYRTFLNQPVTGRQLHPHREVEELYTMTNQMDVPTDDDYFQTSVEFPIDDIDTMPLPPQNIMQSEPQNFQNLINSEILEPPDPSDNFLEPSQPVPDVT